MPKLIVLYIYLYLFSFTSSSTLTKPPQSALIIAFENVYDLSLLANTLSDQGIDATLIVPTYASDELYNNLIDVEVLHLDVHIDKSMNKDIRALEACSSFLKDQQILKRMQEFLPTFTIFPALRHDGCILPWVKYIESIPVIWTGNPEEEIYAFECTGVALPVYNDDFWSRLLISFDARFLSSTVKNDYLNPALQLVTKYLPGFNIDLENLYSDVRLVLWSVDTVLRSDFVPLTQLLVETGCHHCRGSHPLPGDLQKLLVEHRLGTIAALLDKDYEPLILELAQKLPQGREGQAIVWKTSNIDTDVTLPENLFIHGNIDRQDLIGYSRTRVLLSHCTDTEFLEAAFHGTPMICLPRNSHESRNTIRAIELGFARTTESTRGYPSAEEIVNIVNDIQEMVAYRENARKVSVAIRDRLNPASDRLTHWLSYVARTKGGAEKFLKAKSQVKTLTEGSELVISFSAGVILGAILTNGYVIAKAIVKANRLRRSKGRHTR